MALRTTLPGLLRVLDVTCKYIRRNRSRIERFIGDDNIALVDAVITACDALSIVLETIIPEGS